MGDSHEMVGWSGVEYDVLIGGTLSSESHTLCRIGMPDAAFLIQLPEQPFGGDVPTEELFPNHRT